MEIYFFSIVGLAKVFGKGSAFMHRIKMAYENLSSISRFIEISTTVGSGLVVRELGTFADTGEGEMCYSYALRFDCVGIPDMTQAPQDLK